MREVEPGTTQMHMNAEYRRLLDGLMPHAERDLRLARGEGDGPGAAKARARLDTPRAAPEVYASGHFLAHGEWPREVRA